MKIRIVISGIGNRALPKNPKQSNWHGWIEQIHRSKEFQLVGAHDVAEEARNRLAGHGYLKPDQIFANFEQMLDKIDCEAVLISNPAEIHFSTLKVALKRGLHALVEKPFITNFQDGRIIIAEMEGKDLIVGVVQNWRGKRVAEEIYRAIPDRLGRVGHVFFRYIRNRENPNYPPYIFKEPYPLLYAMGIHHLDLLRYVLKDEFISVWGQSFKPPWSMYESETGHHLFLKTKRGITVMYSGTFSSQNNVIPQESMIIEGENGSLINDSDWLEPPLYFCEKGKKEKIDLTAGTLDTTVSDQYNYSDEMILKNFYFSILGQQKIFCSAEDSLNTIATLEGCKQACESREEVSLERFFPDCKTN